MEDGRRSLGLLGLGLGGVGSGRLGDGVRVWLGSCVAGVLLLLLRGGVGLGCVACSGCSGGVRSVRVRLSLLLGWLAVGGSGVACTRLRLELLRGVDGRGRVVGVRRRSSSCSDGLHNTKVVSTQAHTGPHSSENAPVRSHILDIEDALPPAVLPPLVPPPEHTPRSCRWPPFGKGWELRWAAEEEGQAGEEGGRVAPRLRSPGRVEEQADPKSELSHSSGRTFASS